MLNKILTIEQQNALENVFSYSLNGFHIDPNF